MVRHEDEFMQKELSLIAVLVHGFHEETSHGGGTKQGFTSVGYRRDEKGAFVHGARL